MNNQTDSTIDLQISAFPAQVESALRDAGLSAADFMALKSLFGRYSLGLQLGLRVSNYKSIESEPVRLADDAATASPANCISLEDSEEAYFHSMEELLPDVKARLMELSINRSEVTGITTGFHALDELTTGMNPGELIVVAGCPSVGKTTFALNTIEHIALEIGLPVMFFSMAMSATQVATRIVSSGAGVIQQRIRTGRLTPSDWERLNKAMSNLAASPIHVDASSALNISDLCRRARRLWQRYMGLGLIVVDNLQLLSASQSGVISASEVGEISRALKALAKELRVAIVLISELKRPPVERETKRSTLVDLCEYGAIEKHADVIMLLCRSQEFMQDSSMRGKAEIVVAKQRNGPPGIVTLVFNSQYARFENGGKVWAG